MTTPDFMAGSPKHLSNTAPARGLSPIRAPLHTTSKMQPPRSSPVVRPQSPLSPRYEPAARFEQLRPPSPRSMSTRTGISQRRGGSNGLQLRTLPRFHPSNYPSAQSSAQSTPDSGQSSPQAPASPRAHQRVISDAQKHLLAYQREMMSAAVRSLTPTQLENPASPRLVPLGSPGPVTPLELEAEDGGYLAAGARNGATNSIRSEELVERLMREEAARQPRSTARQSPR